MPYELAHDTIARQVYEKASTEARTRRKVERYVREHYLAYQERGVQLTQDDIDYVEPYLVSINISAEEQALIDKAKAGLRHSRRRRRLTVAAVIAVLALTSIVAVLQGLRATAQQRTAESLNEQLEERAEELEMKEDSIQIALLEAQVQRDTAEERQQRALLEKNRADQAALRAERERRIALDQRQEAERQRYSAMAAQSNANRMAKNERAAREEAKELADLATAERDRAEIFRQSAEKQAATSRLSALAIQQRSTNPTVALRLAYEACKASDFQDELAVTTFHQLVDDSENCFYQLDFTEHQAQVLTVAFSPDGKRALSGDADGYLYWWQTIDGKVINEVREHQRGIRAIDFTEDGQYALTAGDDGQVIVWNVPQSRKVRTLTLGAAVKAAKFIATDQSLLAVGADGKAQKWRLSDGQPQPCAIRHRSTIWGLAVSADGQYIMTGDNNGHLRLWTGNAEKSLAAKSTGAGIRGIALLANGTTALVGDLSGKLQAWSVLRLRPQGSWQASGSPILQVAAAPQGNWLVSTDNDGQVKIWDTRTGNQHAELRGHTDKVLGLCFSPDGEQLISGGSDQRCLLWTTRLWQRQQCLTEKSGYTLRAAYSPDGQRIYTGGYDHVARSWENRGGGRWDGPYTHEEHTGYVLDIAALPNGRTSISGDRSGKMVIWDWGSRLPVVAFPVSPVEADAVAVSPDGQWLAVAHEDYTVEIWDLPNRRSIKRMLPKHAAPIFQLTFSQDSRTLYSGDYEGGLVQWDVTTQAYKQTISGPKERILCLSVAPQREVVVVGYMSGELRWNDLENPAGSYSDTLNETGVYSLAFSPGGDQLFVGLNSNLAQVRETTTHRVVQQFTLPTDPQPVKAMDAQFYPSDGREILLAGWDGNTWIIQNMFHALEAGQSIAPLPKPLENYTN